MQTALKETKITKDFRADEISKSFLESAIGNTPLIRLRSVTRDLPENIEIYAKAEYLNPGGSVKDRAALAMILAGEQSGELTRGKTILDATSGNTGIAYAMIGAARGYKVALTLPKNASATRKRILKLYGAEIIETDQMQGTDGAQLKAKELVARISRQIFLSRPIQQRGKLESALRDDRAGNLVADARANHAFCRRFRDDRNIHRHDAPFEGI